MSSLLRERAQALAAHAQALLDEAHAAEALESQERSNGSTQADGELAARLSQENMELASRLAEAEEMNSAMMSMYVSSYQLHATLDPDRVVNTIKEIVINFVGGEEFAILLRDEESDDFDVVAGEGHESRYPESRAPMQGVLGAVVASGEPFVHAEDGAPREGVLAAVPLGVGGRVVGAVVIFKLLQQKTRLMQADVELLHLVSAHAATALLNARMHARMDRKLRTLEGLMDLVSGRSNGADLQS